MNYMDFAALTATNEGSPFGAVIVQNNRVIASSGNTVRTDYDPTAHAELQVIRKACQQLKTIDLSCCQLYSTCNLCPMCVAAVLWAGIKTVHYASSHAQASRAGYSAAHLDDYFSGNNKNGLTIKQIDQADDYDYLWDS